MIIKIILVLAVLLALFLIYAALQPSTFRITRSTVVAAVPDAIFEHVNNLQLGQAWSPWKKLDPAATYTFSGPASGVGCRIEWSGNKDIGAGRQTITESRPGQLVRSHVEFFRPFAGASDAEFSFEPQGGQTKVTWALAGKNNLLAKIFCVFVNQDKMLGTSLAEGLASLKEVVEKPQAK